MVLEGSAELHVFGWPYHHVLSPFFCRGDIPMCRRQGWSKFCAKDGDYCLAIPPPLLPPWFGRSTLSTVPVISPPKAALPPATLCHSSRTSMNEHHGVRLKQWCSAEPPPPCSAINQRVLCLTLAHNNSSNQVPVPERSFPSLRFLKLLKLCISSS